MTTNTAQIESFESQAEAWRQASTDDVVKHHKDVLNQAPRVREKAIVVNGAEIDINPEEVMLEAIKGHSERIGRIPPTQLEAKSN